MPKNTKYFKALLKDRRDKQHTIYGVSFGEYGQTPKAQAEHIALVRGFGTSVVKSLKIFRSGESWYIAQYGKKALPKEEKPKRKK